jgi:hypothetical protein
MPPQAGAVEMLNRYYQETNHHTKHEIYNYVPNQQYSVSLPFHPQGLPQQTYQAVYPPYPATANQSPPSAPVPHAAMLSPTMEDYTSPSDSVHSPQFDGSAVYPTSGGFIPAAQTQHLWNQPLVSEPVHHYQPQPPHSGGNGLVMGFNAAANGHPQLQHMQSPQQQHHRYNNDVNMSQGDIWSSFAQDFRP